MSDQEIKESAKSRMTIIRQNWAIIIFMLTFMVYAVRQSDLTFDNQQQKQRILDRYERPVLTSEEKEALKQLITDPNRHTSFEDKAKLIRIESKQETVLENQIKLGQDMQQIKNLLRR